jgi:mRNA-decapping enzyme subunit 2
MVAPFMLPLKIWILGERKRDRQQAGLNAPEVVLAEDSGLGTDMEAMAPEVAETNEAEARHFQSLLSRLNTSQDVYHHQPELPACNGLNQADELAVQLKKLLSVGQPDPSPGSTLNPQVPAPAAPTSSAGGGSLMSLLRPGPSLLSHHPQTPFEQIIMSPPEAHAPHQSHIRRQDYDGMPPPPSFPFANNVGFMPRNPGPRFATNTAAPYQHYHSPLDHHYQPNSPAFGQLAEVSGQNFAPEIPAASKPQQYHPRGLLDSSPNALMQSHGAPPPSSLPIPKPRLTAHSLSLLNAFNGTPPPVSAIAVSPPQPGESVGLPMRNVQLQAPMAGPASLLGVLRSQQQNTEATSRAEIEGSEVPVPQVQPQQPRNNPQAHTLLNLFRSSGGPFHSEVGSAGRPAELEPPVAELSAGTPYHVVGPGATVTQTLNGTLAGRSSKQSKGKARLTSATVSGPLNSPDFETVVRNRPPAELGSGEEQSVTPVPIHHIEPGMPLEAPQAIHHPSMILQRQMTPNTMPVPNPVTVQHNQQAHHQPASFDRRGTLATDQKSTLMSLFGKVAPPPTSMPSAHNTAAPPIGHQRRPSQNSPVSPLPARLVPARQTSYHAYDSPAQGPPPIIRPIRSRVSSFADEAQSNRASASPNPPITPVEKKFLFQYLEGVVSQGGQK